MIARPSTIKEAKDIVAYFNQTNKFFKNRIITRQYIEAVKMIKEIESSQEESACNAKIQGKAKQILKISTLKVTQDEEQARRYVLINTANNKQYYLGFTEFESIYLLGIKTKEIKKQLVACFFLLITLFGFPACSTQTASTSRARSIVEYEESIWYPTHELYVTYRQDTFKVIAVDVNKRISIIRKGTKQIIRPLDSLKLVE